MKEYKVRFIQSVSAVVSADDEFDAENEAYDVLCKQLKVDGFDYDGTEIEEIKP